MEIVQNVNVYKPIEPAHHYVIANATRIIQTLQMNKLHRPPLY